MYTLEDAVVQDTIQGLEVSTITEDIIIAGGIAVQIHVPFAYLHRPTNDIDTFSASQLTYGEFQEQVGYPLARFLQDMAYMTEVSKTRYGYELCIDLDEPFYYHFNRFSQKFLDRHQEWKLREMENALPYAPKVRVHRIEDVFVNKMRRLARLKGKANVEEPVFDSTLYGDLVLSTFNDLEVRLGEVMDENEELSHVTAATFKKYIPQINQYKVHKDTYDILLLSKSVHEGFAPFNQDYYTHALSTVALSPT